MATTIYCEEDMTAILFQEISNQDIDWIIHNASQRRLEEGITLPHSNPLADQLYLLMEGTLGFCPSSIKALSDSTENTDSQCGYIPLFGGELIGHISGLYPFPSGLVKALTPCILLEIARSPLEQKLQEDTTFAAHLYRAIALLLYQRLKQLMAQPEVEHNTTPVHLKDASTVFAELQDGDIDWLIAVGQVQHVEAGTPLVRVGRPMDNLHIVLDGAVALYAYSFKQAPSPFFSIQGEDKGQEFSRLSRGNLVGELLCLDPQPALFDAIALRESQILSIPRWRLMAKLMHDPDFASRLYRVLVMLLSNKQHELIQHHMSPTPGAKPSQLGHQLMNQIALAEARFDWMLTRLQSQLNSRRLLQWS
ncbi:cyclic nucleotide-binding domain-containing protein [Leptolyngbya sp. FACHB-16]|uniref:cyclic nucleotide-binding domain-containing protein n=1 Tax=unclassified Leptolyngbya TaxID=2650499 RepID=UPI001688020D|nr:cyclic nucleotide-binding domain-containing protein [Leptolyngbya sp. FACHB-16]MBD2157155.1 cyclic nucleotide-binding domain-containing protein [Leptolyngbya sp. FACHB-16]